MADIEALTTLWRERGVSITALGAAGSHSLVGSDRALTSGLSESAGGLHVETEATLAEEPLTMAELLGRGGMGVVHRATQLTLRRDVAVKQLTAAPGSPEHAGALASLLKEAWVGGNLEHPNVVPVHALGEVNGAPAVIMKRIEGTDLRAVLRDPLLIPEGERLDALAFHVRTLVAVCNAVAYAHRRGVLHLDIKPENVMLGHFGEVCLLDWGLAAGFGVSAPSWLPPARDTRSVSGTPDYMAPEVTMADGPNISPATDVYLLGATLHEVVTGSPPHSGPTLMDRLERAYVSKPHDYGSDVPPELVEILHTSMQREPMRRFESAEALRDALDAFLVRRRGEAIVREARHRVKLLEDALTERADEVEVSRRFGAARFALREADAARPDHENSSSLRHRLFSAMAEHAMDTDRLELAATYLDELGEAESLRTRLLGLREESLARAERVQQLENLKSQEDLDVGSLFRRRVAMVLAVLFLVGNTTYDLLERLGHPMDYRQMMLHSIAGVVPIFAFTWFRREVLFRNRANASVYAVALLSYLLLQVFWLSALLVGIPFRSALAASGVFYLLAGGTVSVMISPRFALSPVVAAVFLLGAAALPQLTWYMLGLGASLAVLVVGVAWRDVKEDA